MTRKHEGRNAATVTIALTLDADTCRSLERLAEELGKSRAEVLVTLARVGECGIRLAACALEAREVGAPPNGAFRVGACQAARAGFAAAGADGADHEIARWADAIFRHPLNGRGLFPETGAPVPA